MPTEKEPAAEKDVLKDEGARRGEQDVEMVDAPAAGVIDEDDPDPPEPSEPG
jgi:hypothetical protein